MAADDVPNHEDQEIVDARTDSAELLSIIDQRNKQSRRWGFKLPYAVNHLEWFASALRNPVIVVCFRNPLAIARSVYNRQPGWPDGLDGLDAGLAHGLKQMCAGGNVIRLDAPSVLIDVDAAQRTPRAFMDDLCDTLGLRPSGMNIDEIAHEISSPGYKRATVPASI